MTQWIKLAFIIFGFFIIASPFILMLIGGLDKHIEIVKCYDRFSNEIIGLDCEDEVFNSDVTQFGIDIFMPIFMIGIAIVIISMIIIQEY